jgi:hypothetical protein
MFFSIWKTLMIADHPICLVDLNNGDMLSEISFRRFRV